MTNIVPPGQLGKELLGEMRFIFRGKPREAYASSVAAASSASTASARLAIAMVVWRERG